MLQVTSDEQSSVQEIVSLIGSDAALTARILQLVHRADSPVRAETTTLERAVVLLGFESLRSAVLAVSVFETFHSAQRQPTQFSREDFWKHSLAVACCAELLAEEIEQIQGHQPGFRASEAFVCGLLHDLGKIAFDAILPKSFARVVEAAELLRGNIADVERTVIGLDHMVVGKRLAERWELPQMIRESIWLHDQLPEALPDSVKFPRMINLVTLADLIVRHQHLGYSGNYVFNVSRERLIEAVGLTPQAVEAAMQKLIERIESRACALQLGQTTTQELYQQALIRANQELGRVSGQLAAKNRRLAVRAQFFDAISTFPGRASPRFRAASRSPAPSGKQPSVSWASAASALSHSSPARTSRKFSSSTKPEIFSNLRWSIAPCAQTVAKAAMAPYSTPATISTGSWPLSRHD